MTLAAGARLGSYTVVSSLGSGGMGEVYRARDSKLGRDVAIKVLPELFARDSDRLARSEREAKVLASLNHPNIAHIYGIEDSGGVSALVMELVEGQTLAELISAAGRGGMSLDDVLPIAKQIAEALEAAHEQGIIHRDLKPANIKVRPDGTVKVLDFGLAKALDTSAPSSASAMMSPTISVHGTEAGFILGTAAYMSPEQARGKPADRRADIWAFGVVLFEMLAGRRPFDNGDVSDTLADILKSEPAWQALPGAAPPALTRLLRRCLQKDPRQRLQHIGDARLEIEEIQRQGPADIPRAPGHRAWRERVAWLSAILLVAIVAAVAIKQRTVADAPEMRLEISTPPTTRPSSFALSPDGRSIVFSADGPNGPQLWLRSLDATVAKPIAGTEVGLYPFWSPDSRSIGFFSNNKLKRVDIDGGQLQPLATVLTPAGGTWNSDGTILFVPNDNSSVLQVPARGGDATAITPHRSAALATRLPQFLPDGRHYLFYVARGGEPAGVYIGELGSESIRKILDNDWPAMYARGHLWFVRDGSLFAQPFNPATGQLGGQAIRVADDVGGALFASAFFVSTIGHVAYRPGFTASRRLRWFDRFGKELGAVGEAGKNIANLSLARDDRLVVVQRTLQDNIDLWALDLVRKGDFARLTVNPLIDSMPLLSPDGTRVAFNTVNTITIRRLDGSAPDVPLTLPGAAIKISCGWSADGKFLLYKQLDAQSGTTDLWALPMEGERPPLAVAQTPYDEREGEFSPDGKWVAYDSDESGRHAIYLQPFPGETGKRLVSTSGGSQPRWRHDGRELFYLAPDGYLMAVPMGEAAGPTGIGIPVRLFKARLAPFSVISRQQYAVSRDGQRFLLIAGDDVPLPPITLILNWKPPAQH